MKSKDFDDIVKLKSKMKFADDGVTILNHNDFEFSDDDDDLWFIWDDYSIFNMPEIFTLERVIELKKYGKKIRYNPVKSEKTQLEENDIRVYTYRDGAKYSNYKLIYTNSFLLPTIDENIMLKFNGDFTYTFQFSFSDSGDKFSSSKWYKPEDNFMAHTLHKWSASNFVENSKPVEFEDSNGNRYIAKFRVEYQVGTEFRRFELTIWELIK